jgi:hypothetical protein
MAALAEYTLDRTAEIDESMASFKGPDSLVDNPSQQLALSEVERKSLAPGQVKVLLVIGPSRAGKSGVVTLFDRYFKQESGRNPRLANPAHIPMVTVVAPPPVGGQFPWKTFTQLLGVASKDVLVDRKVLPPIIPPELVPLLKTGAYAGLVTHHHMCIYRQPYVVSVDEAHHIAVGAMGSSRRLQIEILKGLVDGCPNTVHVLFGTRELLKLLGVSDQTGSRAEIVRLDRYHWSREDEREHFVRACLGVMETLPIPVERCVRDDFLYLFTNSWGCVGAFHDWCDRAASLTLRERRGEVTLSDFRRTQAPPGHVREMFAEAARCEEELDEYLTDNNSLEIAMAHEEALSREPEEPPSQSGKSLAQSTGRKGRREPSRDRLDA